MTLLHYCSKYTQCTLKRKNISFVAFVNFSSSIFLFLETVAGAITTCLYIAQQCVHVCLSARPILYLASKRTCQVSNIEGFINYLTLGVHAQRGLRYLVCPSVCLSVCHSPLQATRQSISGISGFSATSSLKQLWRFS